MCYLFVVPKVPKGQSLQYGCAGVNEKTSEVVHYVEKPASFVSSDINAGVYLLSTEVFKDIGDLFQLRHRTRVTSSSSE